MHKRKARRPSPLTTACIATLLIILIRNKKTKKEAMRTKNTHWTYCTWFSQSYKTMQPSSCCPRHPERLCPPWEKQTQRQWAVLSCWLVMTSSASHLHRHSVLLPPTHCSEGGRCWTTGPSPHCVDAPHPPQIWPCWQMQSKKYPLTSTSVFLLTPPLVPTSLVCSKHLCITKTKPINQRVDSIKLNWVVLFAGQNSQIAATFQTHPASLLQ